LSSWPTITVSIGPTSYLTPLAVRNHDRMNDIESQLFVIQSWNMGFIANDDTTLFRCHTYTIVRWDQIIKLHAQISEAWLYRKVSQAWPDAAGWHTSRMYFGMVVFATLIPSLSSSTRIRFTPSPVLFRHPLDETDQPIQQRMLSDLQSLGPHHSQRPLAWEDQRLGHLPVQGGQLLAKGGVLQDEHRFGDG
jgi:hypothetical protein